MALARRRHHRFDDARVADGIRCRTHLLQAVGKTVRRGRQSQRLGGETANSFAIHGELRRARGRNHPRQSLLLDLHQHVGGNGLDLRHDDIRFFTCDQGTQRGAVSHIDDMRTVRHLMPRCILVAVHRDNFHPQTLQGDDDFLAELAAAEQHDFGGGRRKRGTQTGSIVCGHDSCLRIKFDLRILCESPDRWCAREPLR